MIQLIRCSNGERVLVDDESQMINGYYVYRLQPEGIDILWHVDGMFPYPLGREYKQALIIFK